MDIVDDPSKLTVKNLRSAITSHGFENYLPASKVLKPDLVKVYKEHITPLKNKPPKSVRSDKLSPREKTLSAPNEGWKSPPQDEHDHDVDTWNKMDKKRKAIDDSPPPPQPRFDQLDDLLKYEAPRRTPVPKSPFEPSSERTRDIKNNLRHRALHSTTFSRDSSNTRSHSRSNSPSPASLSVKHKKSSPRARSGSPSVPSPTTLSAKHQPYELKTGSYFILFLIICGVLFFLFAPPPCEGEKCKQIQLKKANEFIYGSICKQQGYFQCGSSEYQGLTYDELGGLVFRKYGEDVDFQSALTGAQLKHPDIQIDGERYYVTGNHRNFFCILREGVKTFIGYIMATITFVSIMFLVRFQYDEATKRKIKFDDDVSRLYATLMDELQTIAPDNTGGTQDIIVSRRYNIYKNEPYSSDAVWEAAKLKIERDNRVQVTNMVERSGEQNLTWRFQTAYPTKQNYRNSPSRSPVRMDLNRAPPAEKMYDLADPNVKIQPKIPTAVPGFQPPRPEYSGDYSGGDSLYPSYDDD